MNKKYIVTFGDLHISSFHQFSKIEQVGFSTRELEHLQVAKDIVKFLQEHTGEVESVVFLGDLFHPVGANISCDNLLTATTFINMIQEECIKQNIIFYLIIGNHDHNASTANIKSHKLIAFKSYQNVKVIDTLCEIDNYVFLPYTNNNKEVISNFLKEIKDKENKIVFSHVDIRNAQIFGDIYCDKGVEFEELEYFKAVFQGHFHMPQKLAKNIWVAGSTQRTGFKDPCRGDLLIYDKELHKVSRHKFNTPEWYTLTDDNLGELNTISNDNYVKLILSCDNILNQYNLTKDSLNRFKGKEIMYDVERISSKKLRRSQEDIETESPEEVLVSFINSSTNIENTVKKDNLIQIGLDLINKYKK